MGRSPGAAQARDGRKRPMKPGRRRGSLRYVAGQITTEYIVVALAVIATFFVPFSGDRSAVAIFLEAVRAMHAAGSFALSLP